MRQPSEEEIQQIFKPGKWDHFEAELIRNKDSWTLNVSQMYEYVKCGVDQILGLCKIFETEDISVGSQYHYSGCDTCDYGSSYVIAFTVKDMPLSKEMLAWINKRQSEAQ